MKEGELKYLIALNSGYQFGSKTLISLLNIIESSQKIWDLSKEESKKLTVPDAVYNKICRLRSTVNPDNEFKKVSSLGAKTTTIFDDNYPKILKEIPDPPVILYYFGEFCLDDNLAIAVVGSRKYTSYGERATEKIVWGLANNKITTVSGLALGIDGIVHKKTLEIPGSRTLAIIPSGLDRIYPYSHQALAQKIAKGRGMVISEFPLGMQALPFNFPIRNRIIAGISLATVVIEAAIKSGSFLTAQAAIDYNREVFAIPGSIFSSQSEGTNNLIKLGARPVTDANDILDSLNINYQKNIREAQNIISHDPKENIVLEVLHNEDSTHIDEIVLKSHLDAQAINSLLMLMEMKGYIKNLGGGYYVKK